MSNLPGFTTTLDCYRHAYCDNTFDETVDFTQPTHGERKETAQRHRDETTSQADVLTS